MQLSIENQDVMSNDINLFARREFLQAQAQSCLLRSSGWTGIPGTGV
ncbi:hypothetical protein [Syntrophothermus lipocalidus]|nr:hypothetical protein [Syntrophothermus lipocalidus]